MHNRRLRRVLATAMSFGLACSGARAQFATRGLTPVPFNDHPPVTLGLEINQQQPRINSTVALCFQASLPGYATLWNISTAGKVARIFPNQFSQVGPAAKIDASARYCAGTNNDPFRFRVDGPTGTEDVYLLWTTRPDLQPAGTDYPNADALVAGMQRVGQNNTNQWAAAKITYDIVPPAGPPPVVPPVPPGPRDDQTSEPSHGQDGSKYWILTMGSNVKPLTKSNQDAAMFASEMMKNFNIPDDHVRYLPDFKKADFIAGMAWLTRVAQPQDYVFIFYSGHGGRDKDPSGPDGYIYYLLPYDVETAPTDPKSYLLAQQLAFQINRLQTKNVVTVTDACFSGGVYRGLEAEVLGARRKYYRLPAGLTGKQLVDASAAPTTRAVATPGRISPNGLLLAASRNDETAGETSAGSLFTLALATAIEDGKGGTLMDVFDRASKLTVEHSKPDHPQDPTADGDFGVGRRIVFKTTAQ